MATREVKKYVTGKVDFSIDSLVGGTCSKTSASKDPCPSASSTPSPVEKFATGARSGGGGGSAFSQPTGNGNSSTAAAAALWNQQSANQLTDYISLMAAQHMGLLKAGGNGGVFLPQHPAAAGLLSSNGGSGGAGSHANGNPFVSNFSTDLNKQQAGGANGLWQLPTYLQEALQKSVVLAGPPYSRFFSGQDIGHHGYHPYRKPKRIRTAFNPHQLLRLEQSFDRNHYVVGTERKDLAKSLCLSETQVKVWFQNRRTKFKRQKNEDDSKKSSNDSSNNKNSSAGRSKGDKPSMMSSGAAGDKEVTSSSSSGRGSHGTAGLMALQDGSRSINMEDDDDDVMHDEEEDEEDQILLEDDDESSGNASN